MTQDSLELRDRAGQDGNNHAAKAETGPTWYERSPHDRPAEKSPPNSALERALAVIETLLSSDKPMGLQEIARHLDLPRQSVHRIVNQLLDAGMMQRHLDRDRFALGPRLRRLALNTIDHTHRLGPMHGVLEDLAEKTGETCNLGVLDANDVLLVDRVESHWALRVHSEVGKRLEFHSSGIGKLLVAHLPRERRHRLLTSRPLKRFTTFTLTDEGALEVEFATIRRRGYSVSSQGTMLGLFSIAVPVRDPGGRVLAGLACQAPFMRMTIEQAENDMLPLLLDAARQMEKIIALDFDNGS